MRKRLYGPGDLRHSVVLENPSTPVSNGDGDYTQTWTPLVPSPVSAAILPATAQNMERLAAGTVIASATHIVPMRYHSSVTSKTRITFGSRQFNVVGVMNPEERNEWTVAAAVEILS